MLKETFKTPFGDLLLASYRGHLILCDWKYRKMRSSIDNRIQKGLASISSEDSPLGSKKFSDNEVLTLAKNQITDYMCGERDEFTIPTQTIGTDFQKRVWDALTTISYGKTLSYLELSEQLGDAKAIRAVASANGANALSIIIPCHRVVGSNGDLTGYAGGLNAKRKLLELEGALGANQLGLF